MNPQIEVWKATADRLHRNAVFPQRDAAKLVAEIAHAASDAGLAQVAAAALETLRRTATAAPGKSEQFGRSVAQRRFGLVRNMLHALDAPRFGRRPSPPAATLSEGSGPAHDMHRQVLGLPSGRPLSAAEIRQAFKAAAKTAHPDHGGDRHAFTDLVAARDALLKVD